MKILTIIFIVLAFAAAGVSAQEKSAAKWTRIEFENKNFAISFPPGFIVDAEKREGDRRYRISAIMNGVRMDLSIFKFGGTKERLKIVRFDVDDALSTFSINGFDGRRAASSAIRKIYSERIAIASDNYYYYLSASARSTENAELKRFLFSIHLGGKRLFTQKENASFDEETASLETLKTDADVLEAMSRKYVENKGSVSYELEPAEIESDENNEKFSRPVIILDRPSGSLKLPSSVLATSSGGILLGKLKVNFMANGQVGDIIAYSSADKDFIKSCVDAARKIKFVPAQIDGKNVDAAAVVEYKLFFDVDPLGNQKIRRYD